MLKFYAKIILSKRKSGNYFSLLRYPEERQIRKLKQLSIMAKKSLKKSKKISPSHTL